MAAAVDEQDQRNIQEQIADFAERIAGSAGGLTLSGPVARPDGVQVNAEKGASTVAVKVTTASSLKMRGPKRYWSTWSLTASSPLNKSQDDTDIATLDGMVNAASVELIYKVTTVEPKPSSTTLQGGVCARTHEAARRTMGVVPFLPDACTAEEVVKFGSEADKLEAVRFLLAESTKPWWTWGAGVKLGYQTFEYVDTPTVKKIKQNETPWSVSGFVAAHFDDTRSVVALRAQYQDIFKDASSGVVCPAPGGVGTSVLCQSGPLGQPTATKKKLLSLESRREIGARGIGVTLNYDLEDDKLGVEVPWFFVNDVEKNVGAGIKVGWRDNSSGFTVSLFVGGFDFFR